MFKIDRKNQLQQEILQLKLELHQKTMEHYLQYEIFTKLWWLSIAVIIISFAAWWLLIDKKRLLEICTFGLLVNIFATFLDVSGSEFVFWEYPIHLFPQVPLLLPVDIIVVPIGAMLIYQQFPRWSTYLFASALFAAFMSFFAEPIAVKIGLYQMITWKYIYSFPLYILINIIAKLTTGMLLSIDRNEKNRVAHRMNF